MKNGVGLKFAARLRLCDASLSFFIRHSCGEGG